MKIIFTKDAPKIGRKYEVKEVANGYGRHLVAQGIAEIATKEVIARAEQKKLTDASQKKIHDDLLAKTLAALDGATITLAGKANERGHLFASIHKEEVLTELKRTKHIDLHPDYLILDRPLKEVGSFNVPVVAGKNRAVLKVVIEAGK